MISNERDLDVSKVSTTIITPFSIAARSIVSAYKPVKGTRYINNRRPVIPP